MSVSLSGLVPAGAVATTVNVPVAEVERSSSTVVVPGSVVVASKIGAAGLAGLTAKLVIASLLDRPLSLPASRTGVPGAAGLVDFSV